jgi:hypothetical protein
LYPVAEGRDVNALSLSIRFIVGLIASLVVALAIASAAAASPAGPCAEVPYVGVCIPVGGVQPTPAQTNPD